MSDVEIEEHAPDGLYNLLGMNAAITTVHVL